MVKQGIYYAFSTGEINKSSNCATNESAKRVSYSRNILIEKTEKALVLWIQELTQKRIPIDGELIKEKAIRFYNQVKDLEPSCSSSHIGSPKFSASNGWLAGFLQRHALHNLKIKGEAASADETAAKNYSKVLVKIIEDGGYCPDQVFNADETGLFWKKMPSRTFIAKSEKTASGFKAAKDRVTFLLCSNASEARMLKPLMLNRSLHPRALKGKNIAELPVHFMANKKAWVTKAVFITWFNDCFVPEVKQYMIDMGLPFNVLLIVYNAPGHPCVEHPNVKVVFLPPNTTSLIQPLDQGIIACFKKHYVKLTFRYILEKLENDGIILTEVSKKFSILDCINHAAAVITEIKQHTLNASWKAAWPECVINRSATENTSMLTAEIVTLAHDIGGYGFNSFSENDLVEMIQDDTKPQRASYVPIFVSLANSPGDIYWINKY
ncbi:tigger transposable element-derived protein 1 [Trichonephila clavata]|uniref:Tigger transposable element-derived protein 1 n=1 Tax=Trichonephila clavata TaxID=2740835 RepID=A0A8X6H103_TRICU|nr:tigger transposable element-derived protein 1 [Trichonephila clavata]